MVKFHKLLGASLGILMMLPASHALAAGSSISWDTAGRDAAAQPGQTIRGSLPLNMRIYFSTPNIRNVVLDDLEVRCSGDNIVSRFDLRDDNNNIVSSSNFFQDGYHSSVASMHDVGLTLSNNASYHFNLDLALKNQAFAGGHATCQISNLSLLDARNGVELFSGNTSSGYVWVYNNTPARVSVNPSSPVYQILPSNPSYKVIPSGPSYKVVPSTPNYQVLPSNPSYKVVPSGPSYNLLPSGGSSYKVLP